MKKYEEREISMDRSRKHYLPTPLGKSSEYINVVKSRFPMITR